MVENNKLSTNFIMNKWFLILWILFIFIFPFIIDYFHLTPYGILQSASNTSAQSMNVSLYTASDNVWIFPKVFFLLLFSTASLLFIKDNWRVNAFSLLLITYLFLATASAVLSRDTIQYVLLGGNGRGDGLLYIFSLIVFSTFSYLLYTLYPVKLPVMFAAAVAAAATLESIIVIFQRLGIDVIKMSPYKGYVIGTIGSNGMLAAYLLVAVILTASLLASSYSRRDRWTVPLLLALLLSSWALGLTYNRSSLLGLFIGMALLLALQPRNKAVWFVAAIALTSATISPFVTPNFSGSQRSLANVSTANTRFDIWSLTLKAILKTPGQPLIGAGPDGLKLSILKRDLLDDLLKEYKKEYGWKEDPVLDHSLDVSDIPLRYRVLIIKFPKSGNVRFMHVTLDKAHNLLLDRAVNYGMVSALLWLVLYIYPIFVLLRSGNLLHIFYAVAVAAIFVYYIFWFPVPQVEPIHMALLAIAWGMASLTNRHEETT